MIKKEYNKDLSRLNTFGMKVSARLYLEYDSVADLFDMDFEQLLSPVKHIGGGSNLLFTKDFSGTILHSKIDFIEVLEGSGKGTVSQGSGTMPDGASQGSGAMPDGASQGSGTVRVSVGAGLKFDSLCEWTASKGLWGIENLSGIPGEVGAAAAGNIGAYGQEFGQVVREVYAYDTREEDFVKFTREDCKYDYRYSVFKEGGVLSSRYIITHVVIELSSEPRPCLEYGHLAQALDGDLSIGHIRETIIATRDSKLPCPEKTGSAGSFFKNPVVDRAVYEKIAASSAVPVPHYDKQDGTVKIPAAWLIEQCGWKGRRSGNAAVWEKQPLVLVNATGLALPEEILSLEAKIKVSVREKFGIELSPEVEHI
ncbi:MAG: UDP-N-acetylmuramate dehydrogenase [Bacteroidales bacterium]|nr:UDP-N-acetylmuramate dehydrogenase [Bacteroidales bacterium]